MPRSGANLLIFNKTVFYESQLFVWWLGIPGSHADTKARADFAGPMYGLKPVPFNRSLWFCRTNLLLKPVPFNRSLRGYKAGLILQSRYAAPFSKDNGWKCNEQKRKPSRYASRYDDFEHGN
jgi:hypothetical protein